MKVAKQEKIILEVEPDTLFKVTINNKLAVVNFKDKKHDYEIRMDPRSMDYLKDKICRERLAFIRWNKKSQQEKKRAHKKR
jgi:hypothetical protein